MQTYNMPVIKMLWMLTILFIIFSTISAAPRKSKRSKESSSEEYQNKKSRSTTVQGDVDIHHIEELINDLRQDLKLESEKWSDEAKDLRREIEGVLQYTGTKSRIQDVKIKSLKRDMDDIYSILENQSTNEEEIEGLTTGNKINDSNTTEEDLYNNQDVSKPTIRRYNAVNDSDEKSSQSGEEESKEIGNKDTVNGIRYGVHKNDNPVPNKGS